ncbi:hypothetical protein AYI68_g4238 [Smittium mucronatum]|uniref:Uncharacterized protein n=1 Tax=Smittium mucronatum TaxID=133383 RepID=A0A1R0GXM7_9FUNG|nr:hypothetical protein AYI68_g4238 [Smittium mucronatum]
MGKFLEVYLLCLACSAFTELVFEDKDTSGNANKKKKKAESLKQQAKLLNNQSATFQVRSSILSIALQFIFMYVFGTIYENEPVSKL